MGSVRTPHAKTAKAASETDGMKLRRLRFELALESGECRGDISSERLQQAAEAAGADLLFVLPHAGGGVAAVIRLRGAMDERFLLVRSVDGDFTISAETEIDAGLLGFARASANVLDRVKADRKICRHLAHAGA
jgi:hypothetical protein